MNLRHVLRLAIILCFVGCMGEQFPSGSLEGAVRVGGKPLPQGTLNFTPLEDGRGPTVTAEIKDGRYEIKQVPLGRVRVVIHSMKETGRTIHDRETGTDYPEMQSLVPREYQVSGVEIDVQEGAKTHDFELSAK